MDKGFIAPAVGTGWYWLNPDYMWNGDRLAFVKEYRKKRPTEGQGDLFNGSSRDLALVDAGLVASVADTDDAQDQSSG